MSGLGSVVARQLGVRVTELGESQVFAALENNIIDAAEASQPAIDIKLGLQKIAKHYYFPGWHQPATLLHLIINTRAWEELPKPKKTQIKTACSDNIIHGLVISQSRQFNALKELTKKGVRIHTWSPEILSALKDAWKKTRNKLIRANPDFKRTWVSLETFRKKHAIWREISTGASPSPRR